IALPDIAGHETGIVWRLVTPWIGRILQATACSMLPFRLVRQPPTCPAGEGLSIVPGDMDHRIFSQIAQARCRAERRLPAGAFDIAPPFRSHHAGGKLNANHFGVEDEGPAKALRLGDVAGCRNEAGKLVVGDRCYTHAEWL